MTKIKICGLFQPIDITYANIAHPDYIGFIINFPKSHRSITKTQAKNLRKQLDASIKVVGVFVNAKPTFIQEFVEEQIIDVVQLHGSEDATYIHNLCDLLPQTEIWKAYKISSIADLELAKKCNADRILLDNGCGTGETFDWSLLSTFNKPMILAGGLTPENIVEASTLLHPWAIDISSGVETDFKKDQHKMIAAVAAARRR